eukprot:CAMPEP_0168371422 /NCGR_PEP_ID=MMETSP0228-20121227/7764_1 /TAXON_ID=133427 /ORGANISM="Protoceratium reticulatum, Strain CCCM 535 (=CCMP 1889)" /LENGTH=48 /DNA_ID= /DNA_START= /DNA_END= /DNA_ORIENTATION=
MTRHGLPKARGGMFFLNLVRTTPELPCDRRTLPQITRNFEPLISFLAL